MNRKVLVFETAVVVLTLALIGYIALFTSAVPEIKRPVAELVPKNVAGWECSDLPIAGTEVMANIVGDVLQFDGYTYRIYHKKDAEVSLYVAYWKPGKVSTTDAGVHNPDSCWVNAGMTRVERKYGVEVTIGGYHLKPLEYGLFQIERRGDPRDAGTGAVSSSGVSPAAVAPVRTFRIPVYFWHLVGGEVNRYEDQKTGFRSGLLGRLDRIPLYLRDLRKFGLNQKREQMFIRLVCSKPLEELGRDPDFVRLLRSFSALGIFEGTTWGTPLPPETPPVVTLPAVTSSASPLPVRKNNFQ